MKKTLVFYNYYFFKRFNLYTITLFYNQKFSKKIFNILLVDKLRVIIWPNYLF